jgi:carboxymethylenebutenolidase
MCDDLIHNGKMDLNPHVVLDPRVSRRTFGLMTVAGGAAAAGVANAAAANVVEKDVEIKTPDGTCDAALYYPQGNGTHPAVLIWTDILGLRPAFRDMGRRLAAEGYVVLVPNPFYRSKKAPVVTGAFDFNKPEDRQLVFGFRAAMTDAGIDNDAKAFIAFLDAQPQTNKAKKVGTQGYCMGGPLVVRTAAAVPNRVAAVGSFHGGGLATKDANSPHLLIGKTNAAFVFAVAQNDDMTDPAAKDTLKKTLADTRKKGTVEVYPANHGWCVKDGAAYNEAQAERAWGELLALYKANIA